MMMWNPVNVKLLRRAVAFPAIVSIACLLLNGCGGGISGTGDGGPVTAVDADISGTGNAPTDSSNGERETFELQVLPEQLSLLIAEAFTNPADTTFSSSNVPASIPDILEPLQLPLRALTLEIISVQIDLVLIEKIAAGELVTCSTQPTCTTLPTTITADYSPDIAAFEESLKRPLGTEGSTPTGSLIEYSAIKYQPELSGFFDEQLSYTRENGSRVAVQWTEDEETISLYSESDSSTNYVLLQNDQTVTRATVRRTSKVPPGILQAVLQSDPSDALEGRRTTFIEADLHTQTRQSYVRAFADGDFTTAFSQHPVNSDQPSYRYAISSDGSPLSIDSCIRRSDNSINCLDWQNEFANVQQAETGSNQRFNTFENRFGDFATTLTDTMAVGSLPSSINEYVVATDQPATMPASDEIACGGQRLHAQLRNFCWQPLPLPEPTRLLEELIQTDTIIYLPLP